MSYEDEIFEYGGMMDGEGSENEDFGMDYDYESDDEVQQATYTEAHNLSNQGLGQDFGVDNVTGKRLINRSHDQIFLTKLIDTATELATKISIKPKKPNKDYFYNFINHLNPFLKKFTGSTFNESLLAMEKLVTLYIKNPAIKKQQLNYACFLIAVAIKQTNTLGNFKILCETGNLGLNQTLLVIDNIHVKSIDIFRYIRFIENQQNTDKK